MSAAKHFWRLLSEGQGFERRELSDVVPTVSQTLAQEVVSRGHADLQRAVGLPVPQVPA